MSERKRRQRFLRGSAIFREGQPGDCAYVVETGKVEISALGRGQKISLATLAAGEIFGEMALVDDRLRTATATAVDDTQLIVISRDQLKDRMAKADPLLNHFLRVVLERFRATHGMMLGHRTEADSELSDPEPPERSGEYERDRQRAIDVLELEQNLRRALRRNEFQLYSQPIIALRGGQTAGFESLIRWCHPAEGLLAPARFITVAEDSGVIVAMGQWVFEEACKNLVRFQNEFGVHFPALPPLFVTVNLSARQLADPELVAGIESTLATTRAEPGCMILEITEGALLENPTSAAKILDEIKNLGVKLAIDDFGTGYSSLSYLHRFPIDVVKIDQSFVRTLSTDSGSKKIVHAIVGLAHNLGMRVIGEGIETPEEMTILRDFACDYGQGFCISHPLPPDKAHDLLSDRISW